MVSRTREMIVWREKLVAFSIHFLVTLAVALVAAAIIFLVWYPEPFGKMLGGIQLFLLVSGCDLALGPLLSLVIYNSRKSRRELVTDYTVVGLVQLAALIYGMYVVAVARPAYLVFSKDRIEVITAHAIEDNDLAEAPLEEYRRRPWLGPEFVTTVVPSADETDALMQGLAGKDVSVRPKFYVPYESRIELIKIKLNPLSELTRKFPARQPEVTAALQAHGVPVEHTAWLPVQHRRGFWTALVDTRTGYPFDYLDLDPY
jgi:hypothetical protein